MEIKEVKVEAFSDDDGSKNSLEFGHETVEVADIKREIVWEWESEFESKKRTGLQVSENPISIFVTEEKSVKNEYNDGKNLINDEEIMTSKITDPLEMQNDSNAPSKSYPRKGKRKRSAEKLHKCDQCDYSAARKFVLTQHKRIHSGEKPYACDQCSYSTAVKFNLTQHKRIHSGDKPHKCDQCDFSTVRKTNLTKHKRIHSGEKPYKCDQCSFSSAVKFNLTQHKRIHSGEKPFQCKECGYSSARPADLTRHLLHCPGTGTMKEVHSTIHVVKKHKDTTKVKESKASLVTIPINVITMLESVKEETLEPKIEVENGNSGYIENTEDNLEMETTADQA